MKINTNLNFKIMSKKFNVVVVEDLRNSLKESKNVEITNDMVVDFLNEYLDEEMAEESDVVKSDSMLDELFNFVNEGEECVVEESDVEVVEEF